MRFYSFTNSIDVSMLKKKKIFILNFYFLKKIELNIFMLIVISIFLT